MALWELDEFQGPKFLGFVRNVPVPAQFSGARYLPDRTVTDLDFEYILGSSERPVMAHVMGWDSEAPIHGRPGLGSKVSGELPPIKRKAKISEKELIRFLTPRAGTADAQQAIDSVYGLTKALLDSVQARVEWLRMQALSEDTVTYDEAGVIFQFDFGITNDYQINFSTQQDGDGDSVASDISTVWSDTANANWVADLQWICDKIEDEKGFRPKTMVCSRTVKGYMLNNAAARSLIRGSSAPAAVLTDPELQALLDLYGLPRIETYDVQVNKENADGSYTATRPLAQNKVVLLPGPEVFLGETLWGPTAESRRLIGTPLAQEAPGIYAVVYGKEEPPSEWTKAVGTAFPSLPGADFIAQLQVAA